MHYPEPLIKTVPLPVRRFLGSMHRPWLTTPEYSWKSSLHFAFIQLFFELKQFGLKYLLGSGGGLSTESATSRLFYRSFYHNPNITRIYNKKSEHVIPMSRRFQRTLPKSVKDRYCRYCHRNNWLMSLMIERIFYLNIRSPLSSQSLPR